jgi:nucleoside-diphosphate-sugar epimerase
LVLERLPTEATYEEARVGDVPPARVSAQKAKEVLGWEASVPFEQGLRELIEAYLRA